MNCHSTAVVHKATRIAENVTIGPYAVIEDGVQIGGGTVIREGVSVRSGTIIGEGCFVDAHAVIGGLPQDTAFNPRTPTGVTIGNEVVIRENVTVNRATVEGTCTKVGNGCLLMAGSHVGHDCLLGEHVILANNVMLGGRVPIGAFTFMGGGSGVHQGCRVGESVMVGGNARVTQDAPSFCMMAERNELVGLNLVGLRRRGFEREVIRELKSLFHLVFSVNGRPAVLAKGALDDGMARTPQGQAFLHFMMAESTKGIMRPRREIR